MMVGLMVSDTYLTFANGFAFGFLLAPYTRPFSILVGFRPPTAGVGADFVFATGTLFVARVCLPHEQSVGGALFQTLTQLGTAFGLAISTVVFNATLKSKSESMGVTLNADQTNAPRPAQLTAYKDAMWTGFAFGLFGASLSGHLFYVVF